VVASTPADAAAYYNLGLNWQRQGQHERAVEAYRQALALKPDYAEALNNLGNTLTSLRRFADAEGAFRQALAIRPGYARAWFNLAWLLEEQGKDAAAEAGYRHAVAARPDYAAAHCNLGGLLQRAGRFAEAIAELERGLALVPAQDPLRPEWQRLLGECRRWHELEGRLPAVLRGEARPADAGETIAFARLCAWRHRRQYAAAARLYADAFAAEPARARDLKTGDRYAAACAAARAGCGEGADAPPAEGKERAAWRQQALAWLRADLVRRAEQVESGLPGPRHDARVNLAFWNRDESLACVRAPASLALLPRTEQGPWRQLWADLDALLERLGPGA
jgi:Tfp pilus assembly protein PilF